MIYITTALISFELPKYYLFIIINLAFYLVKNRKNLILNVRKGLFFKCILIYFSNYFIIANYGFNSVCYGHAGDGNLHINIIKGEMSDDKWNNDLTKAIKEIFKLTVSLGGTISGEHGIGYVQKDYISIAFSEKEIELQKQIKNIFDPNNILNPGKIFN